MRVFLFDFCINFRFSSGDLSSECDDIDPNELPPAARPAGPAGPGQQPPPLQQQPMPGGPPNIPPPPGKIFNYPSSTPTRYQFNSMWMNLIIQFIINYLSMMQIHKKQQ